MGKKLEDKIVSALFEIMSDGFNRSISALEEVGALDLTEMRSKYAGVGSAYYDVVARELE